ncbi:MAG: carbohydrate ABC transporter permease [Candidatus Methylacidiphilales bacterium]
MSPTTPINQDSERIRRRAKFWQRTRLWSTLYLLLTPTILSLLIFSYYPKVDVVIMSFFRWEPPSVMEYHGLENFRDAFADPNFWNSFKLVGILLVANVLKLWPGIFAAIALHRLANDRLRYIYQVLFVVPMIIPGMVWLLIWKSFYDPSFGLLNKILNTTGLMGVLNWFDQVFPALATSLNPVFTTVINPLFGSVGGLFLLGGSIAVWAGRRPEGPLTYREFGLVLLGSALIPIALVSGALSSFSGGIATFVLVILWMVFTSRVVGKIWVLWSLFILGGVFLYSAQPFYLPTMVAVAGAIAFFYQSRFDPIRRTTITAWTSGACFALGCTLILFGKIWTQPLGEFEFGTPAWLGSSNLVIPSLLFWGFPWVGTVGVLIYLSGLQNISTEVYEAAELDGVGPIGKIFHIELPLIMTQVRINLIFMTIGTLTAYELFLILLGPDGGPGKKGMVPGLYMFSSAFSEGKFGYACALGMILFVVILVLTIIYQRYVKVDK